MSAPTGRNMAYSEGSMLIHQFYPKKRQTKYSREYANAVLTSYQLVVFIRDNFDKLFIKEIADKFRVTQMIVRLIMENLELKPLTHRIREVKQRFPAEYDNKQWV